MRTAALLSRAGLPASLLLAGCTSHLLSGVPQPDASRPVAWVETTGGAEMAASTTEGVLLLGRTAREGPCRVHWFLGPTPVVEDGMLEPYGGSFMRVRLDLDVQKAELLPRRATPADPLVALVHTGTSVTEIPVTLATDPRLDGDALVATQPLPPGTPVFVRGSPLQLVGLVAGTATLGDDRFVVLAGYEPLREALATPRLHPAPHRVIHRPDDISVIK